MPRKHMTGEEFASLGSLTFHWWSVGLEPPDAKRDWFTFCRWNTYDGVGGQVKGIELGLPKLLGRKGYWTNLIVRWK